MFHLEVGDVAMSREADLVWARARELARREDTYLTEGLVDEFLGSGGWGSDSYLDLLATWASGRPEAPAIIDQDGAVVSWGELRARSEAFAVALGELGYQRGDCLGVQLPNWSEFCSVVLGAARIGVRPCFIHVPYRAREMEYILGLTEAKGLVVPETHRGFDHLRLAQELQRRLPGLRDVITVRAAEAAGGRDLRGMIEACLGRSPEVEPPVATELFVLMFTSGTTSQPKGVMHLHANLLNACRKYVADFGLGPQDRWLIVTPLTHLTAFGISLLAGAMTAGACVVLLESWDVGKALELCERHRITHLVGAPPMLIDIARSPDLERRDLSSLRFLMYAGAPCPIEILRRLHDRLGCALAVFYGWTEGLAHTYSVPSDPLEVTSVTIGRSGAGWGWRVLDEKGRDVAPGETGEFWGRGPNLSPGYYRRPQLVRERFTPDGWFRSGDLVTRNPDGTFTFVARADDVINRGGQKVDPREVEELLYQMPSIRDAVVVAMPDPRLGSRGCAFVVPAEGATVTLADLQAHLERAGVAKYKWPERVEILESLPMTPTGKIMRYELRARAEALAGKPG
ncbi:MAG TPA: class I adenylate-forming enzyme family protein [Candidatus Dormibacteraeota bacterium]|nr:class I adenylate-forming enzyme family protein [Candidatus Dormibacteraeota bacterium]